MDKQQNRQLLVATRNRGKLAEFERLLGDLGLEFLTLDDVGVAEDVAETGSTFLENATLKAGRYAMLSGLYTLADDSGLMVEALGGDPGVHSARYGGPGLTAAQRYRLLLSNLEQVPMEKRIAQFVCVIVLAGPAGNVLHSAQGVCEGRIALEAAGTGGFGYDPVFYLPERSMTMAQIPEGEKNWISHRGRAMRAIEPFIPELLA